MEFPNKAAAGDSLAAAGGTSDTLNYRTGGAGVADGVNGATAKEEEFTRSISSILVRIYTSHVHENRKKHMLMLTKQKGVFILNIIF